MADKEIINGYRLQRTLHSGQISDVLEVVELTSHRHFAMKLLSPKAAGEAEHRKNLFYEAEVGKKLAHENVVRILSVNKDKKTPHFIMEFFPSGSLRSRMLGFKESGAKDAVGMALTVRDNVPWQREFIDKVFKQMATGLAYMNAKGFIHRDLKPDNVLVNPLGVTKLIDFAIAYVPPKGMARWFTRKPKQVQGTRSYMSPEQIRGELLDPRADVYSFGATCYEVLTGRPPFRGAGQQELLNKHLNERPVAVQALNPEISDDFNAFLMKTLAKKRDDRPKDFHEVLMQMRNFRVFKPLAKAKPGSEPE